MSSTIRGSDYFDSGKQLGVNQTWQDVTASRSEGVTYTNDTESPIQVNVSATGLAFNNWTANLICDGVTIISSMVAGNNEGALRNSVTGIIPAGSTYSIDIEGSFEINIWAELR